MSTKMNKLVLLSALMIAIIGTFGTVSAVEPHNLVAGGDQVVGNVTVTNDGENISVTFTTTDGWCMTETHLHIANESEDGIPQTKKGNPRPGQFDYSEVHEPSVTEYTYVIPLDGLSGDVYIAAHAVVRDEGNPIVDDEGNLTFFEESAWGNDKPFKGKNWAMYSTYTIPPTPTATLPPLSVTE
ncbi:MAG: hypothetical protein C5S44_01935 [Candidatus Methanocomedens sp.]|nr:MAG: hypothetical protein C5S44_01935 [ANME-2 cluster archaeon]